MVTTLGVTLGAGLTLFAAILHFARGRTWQPGQDMAEQVLERRAATVPETDFPEPINRSIGGGGAVGAIGGASEGELEEGEGEAEAEEEGPWTLSDDEAETFEIEFEKEGQTIAVSENETLLEAGEDEGWDLPYACREGQCLSCGGHIPDGPADDFLVHHNQEMLSQDELDDGYTLTCVAYPQADFTLETGEAP